VKGRHSCISDADAGGSEFFLWGKNDAGMNNETEGRRTLVRNRLGAGGEKGARGRKKRKKKAKGGEVDSGVSVRLSGMGELGDGTGAPVKHYPQEEGPTRGERITEKPGFDSPWNETFRGNQGRVVVKEGGKRGQQRGLVR